MAENHSHDVRQGIADILVDQIIDLRTENKELRLALELLCGDVVGTSVMLRLHGTTHRYNTDYEYISELADELVELARQELEAEKQSNGPKDAVL